MYLRHAAGLRQSYLTEREVGIEKHWCPVMHHWLACQSCPLSRPWLTLADLKQQTRTLELSLGGSIIELGLRGKHLYARTINQHQMRYQKSIKEHGAVSLAAGANAVDAMMRSGDGVDGARFWRNNFGATG
jgi:hypothetical protein